MTRQAKWAQRALRRAWTWLTSMRTALILLFLLALGAVPGALLPQRSLNSSKVDTYLATNGKLAEIYDHLQLFDVFSSSWFTAIYVLLMISLVGCILPRSWDHYRALRTPPVRAPRRFERLPLHGSGEVAKPLDEVAADVRRRLRGWQLRETPAEEDRAGALSFSAERGYLREFFNLVFHLSIVLLLIAVAAGRLVYYEGQVIVVTESGSNGDISSQASTEFCNTSTANYDSFRAGALFDGTGLHPFCFHAHTFSADYTDKGQAEMFASDISYAEGEGIYSDPETWQDYTLRVNHPLRIAGDRIYLQGHGFAPSFTITWPNGESRTQTVPFRPDDPTYFLSTGVLRFDPPAGMYPDLYERRQNQLAIQGLFAPTAAWSGGEKDGEDTVLSSSFPALQDPAVAIDIYRGDNGLDTGVGQSLYDLDPTLVHSGQLQRIDRVNLLQGESVTLDDGTEVTFNGANEYANFQVSHDPTQGWMLGAALSMIVSLVASLMIRRRRIWVRLRPGAEPGVTLVETAGLARTDHAGWGKEYEVLHRRLLGLPDPDDDEPEEDAGEQ